MSKEKKFGNFGPDDDLEKKHFGEHRADGRYPCMRDEYNWGNHRPMVPDSRVITKENTVIHGLEDDAKIMQRKEKNTKLLFIIRWQLTTITWLEIEEQNL